MEREFTSVPLQDVEVRADGATEDERTFTGYGSVFDVLDSYGTTFKKGSFRKSLTEFRRAKRMPPLLAQHGGWGLTSSDLMPVGKWLRMEEDDTGLRVEGRLSRTPRGDEAYTLLKDGAIDGLSIGFAPRKYTQGTKPDEPKRAYEEVELIEVSLVTFPANGAARVSQVRAPVSPYDKRFLEAVLCDAGLSRREAKALIASGFDAIAPLRDAVDGMDLTEAEEIGAAIGKTIRDTYSEAAS